MRSAQLALAAARLVAACLGAAASAYGASLSACAPSSPTPLTPACRSAIAAASADELLLHIQPWVSERLYAPALQVLDAALSQAPQHALLRQRRHELQSLADEAAWSERKPTQQVAPADVDQALLEIRCTRLAGEVALAACEYALRRNPGDARLLVARGDLLLTLGRVAEAEAVYRAAAARDPALALEPKIAAASALRSPAPGPGKASDVAALSGLALGRYHALLIGIDAYQQLEPLRTAVNDAKVMASVLRSLYEFEVRLLSNATRADIVEALDELRERLRPTDNLLIYYAGHGWLDTEADKGFWLPVDARADRRTQWVSNDTVRDALRALKAKHVLVVADSCFSGALTRGALPRANRGRDYVERMARQKARQVLSSGGLEPVADSSGSGHSPFAAALIGALRANAGVLDASSLFTELRRPVALNSDQVPQFADIRMAGHEGGDFLFVRRK